MSLWGWKGITMSATPVLSAPLNDEVVAEYLTWAEVRARLSPRTLRTYRTTLDAYLKWLGERPLSDIKFDDVEDFGNRHRRGRPPAAATARKDIVCVRQLHEWAHERDLPIRRVSRARAPKVIDRNPKPIDDDIWLALWTSPIPTVDRLWLGLGYFCGLRRIEIVTIGAEAIDFDRGHMSFVRKGGSTQPIEYVEMIDVVADSLPHLAESGREFIGVLHEYARDRVDDEFLYPDATGNPELDGNRLNKRLYRHLCPVADIPSESVTPHRLRHSCATNLLRAGVEPHFIMDALSHADIGTTMRYMKTSGQLARWRRGRERRDERTT